MIDVSLTDLLGPVRVLSVVQPEPALWEVQSDYWQGHRWSNLAKIYRPSEVRTAGAVVWITGDRTPEVDDPRAIRIAELVGAPVATIFGVPCQPLDDRVEDDLIAHSFAQYIATGDSTWPALFPMARGVRSVLRWLAETQGEEFGRVVICGASKRGWTAWLVGLCGEKSVVGMAPTVFDYLNMPAQREAQLRSFEGYSEKLEDYTRRGLHEILMTPRGRELARMVDPFTYLGQRKIPTLIGIASNDEFWTVDSSSIYLDAVVETSSAPVQLHVYENRTHGFGEAMMEQPPFAAFIRAVLAGDQVATKGTDSEEWQAFRPDQSFVEALWRRGEPPEATRGFVASFRRGFQGDQMVCEPIRLRRLS